MQHNVYASLLVMFLTIYSVRALPLTLIRKEIKSRFIQSFLYYVPYVSLSVMTFPSILSATDSPVSGLVGFLAGVVLAWVDGNLFRVSIGACTAVFIAELLL
ncbi:MAG: AzlD domain-containing protein [Eubacteriales bacterium]|nr:AzlD domain-containing protein [Eubacteriales bacterium]